MSSNDLENFYNEKFVLLQNEIDTIDKTIVEKIKEEKRLSKELEELHITKQKLYFMVYDITDLENNIKEKQEILKITEKNINTISDEISSVKKEIFTYNKIFNKLFKN
jgi:hypothetical protein